MRQCSIVAKLNQISIIFMQVKRLFFDLDPLLLFDSRHLRAQTRKLGGPRFRLGPHYPREEFSKESKRATFGRKREKVRSATVFPFLFFPFLSSFPLCVFLHPVLFTTPFLGFSHLSFLFLVPLLHTICRSSFFFSSPFTPIVALPLLRIVAVPLPPTNCPFTLVLPRLLTYSHLLSPSLFPPFSSLPSPVSPTRLTVLPSSFHPSSVLLPGLLEMGYGGCRFDTVE